MNSIELTAPAKVNLFLKVLSKRRDSYHNILTLFERISLADEIRVRKIPEGIKLASDKFITHSPKENIAYKAARAILSYKKIKTGVSIKIRKNIPIAAGLAGGSSDAAAVLLGIDKLFGLKLKTKELIKLASSLGADVPFFILDTPFAVGKEKGGLLTIVKSKKRFWHLIIYPGFSLSAGDIYEAYDSLSSTEHLSRYLTTKHADVRIHLRSIKSMMRNDLERIVVSKRPVIGRIIERLAHILGMRPMVSGSGPSVFCLYETRRGAIRAKERLEERIPARERTGWEILVAGTKI